MSEATKTAAALVAAVEAQQKETDLAAAAPPPESIEVPKGWRVETLADADWALARIRDLRAEQQENEDLLAEATRRVQRMNEQAARGIAWFEANVLSFMYRAKDRILKGGRRKSRPLVHGTIGWRGSQSGLRVTDEDALVAWAQEQDPALGLCRVLIQPNLKAIKEYAEGAHLVPPGMEWKDGKDEPYVKPNLEGLVLATRKENA